MNQKQINYIISRIKSQTDNYLLSIGMDRKTQACEHTVGVLIKDKKKETMYFEQWWKQKGEPTPLLVNLRKAINQNSSSLYSFYKLLYPEFDRYTKQATEENKKLVKETIKDAYDLLKKETETIDNLILGSEEDAKKAIAKWEETISKIRA